MTTKSTTTKHEQSLQFILDHGNLLLKLQTFCLGIRTQFPLLALKFLQPFQRPLLGNLLIRSISRIQ